jgi:hypothetical protein
MDEARLMELLVNKELDEARMKKESLKTGNWRTQAWSIFSRCLNNPLETSLNLRFYLRVKA